MEDAVWIQTEQEVAISIQTGRRTVLYVGSQVGGYLDI